MMIQKPFFQEKKSAPLIAVHFEQGSKMTIRCKDWTDSEDFVWTFDGVGSLNKTANLRDCGTVSKSVADAELTYEMPKTLYKFCGDDTAPIEFNGSYFSGNHAITGATQISVNCHSLTVSDIGSIWTDSDSSDPGCYMLARIDSPSELTFINLAEQITSGNGPFNYQKHIPVSPLVHSGNGTHTSDISFHSFTNSVQLHPGMNHVRNQYYVDDVEITENGLYVGNKVSNKCTYDVIYIPAILEHLKANVGSNTNDSYYSDEITEKYMHIEVIHEFRPNGSQTTYCRFQVDARSSLDFAYIYTAQVMAFGKPSQYYVPGTYDDTIITHDGTRSLFFDQGSWNEKEVPPYRYFILNDDMSKGFQVAFSKNTYWGMPENRIGRIISRSDTGAGWSPTTCKLYPIWTGGVFDAGETFDSITGRIPLNMALNNGTTAIGWYWEHDDMIITVDSHKTCDTNIPLPSYMHNKRLEILDSTESVISILPDRISEELHYATNADKGHLVVKLYD